MNEKKVESGLEMSFGDQIVGEEISKNEASDSINLDHLDAEVRGMEEKRIAAKSDTNEKSELS